MRSKGDTKICLSSFHLNILLAHHYKHNVRRILQIGQGEEYKEETIYQLALGVQESEKQWTASEEMQKPVRVAAGGVEELPARCGGSRSHGPQAMAAS